MAKLYGLHRSTLHEAVTKGRITAGLDGKGQKVIDLSEMIRVYGEPSGSTRHSPTPSPDVLPTLAKDALHPLLEELRLLREEVRELRNSLQLLEHKPAPPLVTKSVAKSSGSEKHQEPATWASLFSALDE
ncbi:entry exclusion protein 1 [Pseudomonas violetae]|uniref:Entry exclusion protein 1 n=1 Tax=Pseudomonas violetae TaxID=2915813 RepID=A0ABT0F968_9PSED|nr:entry exclusion protein 1 [Pseudomonas violetae]MCK1794276.1 entry exclusion protein 1 [Pseudomonas violetae]